MTDMELKARHGFYELSASSDRGRALVDQVRKANLSDIGTDASGHRILLDSFFGAAADWCAKHVVGAGMSLQWGDDIYTGAEGVEALDFG